MWATVRPITKNTKLREKVASKVIVNYESPLFIKDVNEKLKQEFLSVIPFSISMWRNTITRRQVHSEANSVAFAWFKYVTSYIIQNATSSPMFDNKHEPHSIITGADINWSIKNLPSTIWLQALGYCFYDIVFVQKKNNDRSDMKEILSPCLHELGERSLVKFSRKCWELFTNLNSLGSFTISFEGIFELKKWMTQLFSFIMNKADKNFWEKNEEISAGDILWAFNWLRLNRFSNISMFLSSSDKQDSNHIYKRRRISNKRKRKREKKLKKCKRNEHDEVSELARLPYLHWDILRAHVLTKLPFDSLFRFKSVCKNWKKTIPSTLFQCLSQEREDHQIQSFCVFHNSLLDTKQFKLTKFSDVELTAIEIKSTLSAYQAEFYASCNGILCLTCDGDDYLHNSSMIIIGNPLTGEWTSILPPNPAYKEEFDINVKGPGLAVNLSSNSLWYKIVVSVYRKSEHRNRYEGVLFYVFSSETGEWKASKAVLPKEDLERCRDSVYANGVLYWVSVEGKLYWFDLQKDVVGSIDIPGNNSTVMNPVIACINLGGEQMLSCSLKIKKKIVTYGVVGNHQLEKLFSIYAEAYDGYDVHPFPYLGGQWQLVWKDMYMREKHNMSIIAYNIENGKHITVADCPFNISWRQMFAFKMNLSPLPRIREDQE